MDVAGYDELAAFDEGIEQEGSPTFLGDKRIEGSVWPKSIRGSTPKVRTTLPDSAHVASASTIPNRDARNIPLRVDLKQGDQSWQDEVLMIQEGQCWVIDDVRYLGGSVHATAGTLRQSIENR